MVKTGVPKLHDDLLNLRTQAASQVQRAPNEPATSPKRTGQVPSNEEGTTQPAGSLHSSASHSSRPERSQADGPRATALAPSPNQNATPSGTVLPPYPMPGPRVGQDRPPATDTVPGGPSATPAAALNDKLDWIAQRFDRLECRQDAAEHHSDDSAQQLQLLLQWARQRDEAERALTDDDDPFTDRRPTGGSPGDQSPTGQCDTRDEQAHTPGLNDSSTQRRGVHSRPACQASSHA